MDTAVPYYDPCSYMSDKVAWSLWYRTRLNAFDVIDRMALKVAMVNGRLGWLPLQVWVPVGSPAHKNGSLI